MLVERGLIGGREVIDDPDTPTVGPFVPGIERQLENGVSVVPPARKTLPIESRVECPVARFRVEITLESRSEWGCLNSRYRRRSPFGVSLKTAVD